MSDYTAKPARSRNPEYNTVQQDPDEVIFDCPVCGSRPTLEKIIDPDQIVSWVVCCSNSEPIGPQSEMAGFINEGCLLYLPPPDFEKARRKEAVLYWNEYASALELFRCGGEDE